MTMTVRYNSSANHALIQTNRNDMACSKTLGKVASGMKINSAQDDAASYSISSRMRVKLRALDQAAQNVQNGKAILNTAEGGIQRQIDLIRTIREKVIDAANDSNTDEDRQTIQKELIHLYYEMESIAYGTDFNSKKPLLADKIVRLNEDYHTEVDNTKLNLIRDAEFEMLDNVYGPFAIFEEYSNNSTVTLGTTSGYVPGKSKVMSIDFANYTSASDLNNVGFKVGSRTYVLTDDTSKNYRSDYKISIAGCTSVNDVIDKVKNYFGAKINGTKLEISTSNINGASGSGGTVTTPSSVSHNGTGADISGTTSGGVTNPTNDLDYGPLAAPATLTVSLAGVTSNTGFRFNGYNFRVIDSGANVEGSVDRTITKGQNASGSTNNFSYTFDGSTNTLTFTAKSNGANYNGYSISNGYTYYTNDGPASTTVYTAYSAFSGAIETVSDETPSTPASYSLDFTGMTVDDFSAQYAGKIFRFTGSSSSYKLYDSARVPELEGFLEDDGSREYLITQININDIRQAVNSGQSLAQAFASRLGGTVDGDSVKFTSSYDGAQINLSTETLRHYDVNFSNLNVKIPDGLYGKGFRFYCATDNKEWFNFVFTDGTDAYNDPYKNNIKSINIDVSNVKNIKDLIKEIYNQANPILTSTDKKFNHHMRLAADYNKNTLTIYDHRRFNVNRSPYQYQQMGAKIADGVSFKEVYENERRNFSVKELVIQHTDKAGMNIHIKIPQMTLDHIFDPLPDYGSTIFDYPVTSKDSRDALLGKPKSPGILDNGLKYLLDAVTLVGAQNKRLEFTAENITTEAENLTASKSTISDADMAKEMTRYTKYNVLAKAAHSMLAQANQIQSMVLSLLQ